MVTNLIPWRRRRSEANVTRLPREEGLALPALHQQFSRLFEDLFDELGGAFGWPRMTSLVRPFGRAFPQVDFCERETEYQVTADLPGLDEKDVQVLLDDDALTIKGASRQEHEEKKTDYYLMERSSGEFQRVIPLPRGVDVGNVKASFKKGVLRVTLPKTAEAQEHRRVVPVAGE